MPLHADALPPPVAHGEVIVGSSLGAMFEWYDFYFYGVLAPVLAGIFFQGLDKRLALVAALLTFAAGFIVRPVGALSDRIGRKAEVAAMSPSVGCRSGQCVSRRLRAAGRPWLASARSASLRAPTLRRSITFAWSASCCC